MKLRCTHNSLRIRVRKSDLNTLGSEGRVEDSVHFSVKSRLVFEIIIGRNLDKVGVKFTDGRISVILPEQIGKHWMESNEVGIETYLPLPEDDTLHVLLEKDFPCLDRENEDKSDTFFELVPDQGENC